MPSASAPGAAPHRRFRLAGVGRESGLLHDDLQAARREHQEPVFLAVMAEAGRQVEAPLVRVAAALSGAPAFRQEADRRRAEPFHLQPRHVDLHELALAVLARLLPGVVDGGPARGVVFQGRLGHCVSFLMGMAVPPRGRASRRVVGAIAGVEGRGTPNDSYFSFGAFRRPRGSLRRCPFGRHPCSPRPDRSGTFGVL